MRKKDKRILDDAIARLKPQGLEEPLPQEVIDDTARRVADCRWRMADSNPRVLPIRSFSRLAVAAALVITGYAAGRLSAPVDMDRLRDSLTPAVAASLEPALRQELAGTYVKLKDDLTAQYREDLNRFAIQTLAASNAATNELLNQLVQAIGTAQAQDQRRVAQALYEIESKRLQDRTQLAAGLQTLAYRTDDELSRTNTVLASLLVGGQPQQATPTLLPNERSNQ
jgi:uncharacterized protein (DUF2267 family)